MNATRLPSRNIFSPALLLVGVIALNGVILSGLPVNVRAGAAYLLAVPVNGYLVVSALGLRSRTGPLETVLLAFGCGYSATVLLILVLSYLPGGLQRWQTFGAFNVLAAALFVITYVRGRHTSIPPGSRSDSAARGSSPRQQGWLWLGLAVLLVLAAFLRIPGLGYSEFQDDEVTVVWHAAEVIQGREDALFVHDKGPAEILISAAVYSLTDRTNESSARLPFALANIVALLAVFWLGRRFFGPVAGWVAASLLAVDGYFIGFSRIVQYQSIVFLMVVLVAGTVYQYYEDSRTEEKHLYLAALFFATGVLAHYEAAIVALPAAYLGIKAWQQPGSTLRSVRNLLLPALLALAILLLFYVPFSMHPRFARTFSEITGNRIGTGYPYNNLADFFTRTIIYSSTYYFAVVTIALSAGLLVIYRRTFRPAAFWFATGILVLMLVAFFASPDWLEIGGTDYAWLAFAITLVPAVFGSRVSVEERASWLWFSAVFIMALFFVQKPRTHVYDFFIPMSLIVGNTAALGWHALKARTGRRRALAIAVPTAAVVIVVFANYGYWMFVHNRVEVLRTWEQNRPAGYWTPMAEARQNAIFGFPFKNGWKVVGALYADGTLDAPYARNGKRGVSNWYTRGSAECSRDAQYFVFTPWNEATNKGLIDPPRRPTSEDGYELIHVVKVNGETRLEIFERDGPPVDTVRVHDVVDYEPIFDAGLSGPVFEAPGVAAWTRLENPLDYRLGEHIWLRGYSLENRTPRPGERVELTLYWEVTETPARSYKVFTQVIDPESYHKAGQRDGLPVCDRLPTDRWLPGDTIVDRYSIVIEEDAPAGNYALLIGMYDSEEERLDVFNADGQILGDALSIDTISVGE